MFAPVAGSHFAILSEAWDSIRSTLCLSSPRSLNGPTAFKIALDAFKRTDGSFSADSNSRSVSTASVLADVSLPTDSFVNCVRISDTRCRNSNDELMLYAVC